MQRIEVAPVQWSKFKDIDDVEPLNDGDVDCLAEIRDVLAKHGKMSRLGIALLHSHFNLSPGEVMIEESDEEHRRLITRPATTAETGPGSIGTIWMLQDGGLEAMAWCRQYCQRGGGMLGGHLRSHTKARS